ncbi:hypothetical protein [Achromobacter sp. NCFB-sbj8-Ac1-l]|uniref:hypothetical protein n=1 Tax=unclassified Achromobacter TaxID=2626865 RepID=UPI004046D168
MDLEISRPMRISFDVLEIEERLPSIKLSFHVDFVGMAYSLSNFGEIWVACNDFDGFVNGLGVNADSRFSSIDGNFKIDIFKKEEQSFFSWSSRRETIQTAVVGSFYESPISNDEIFAIKNNFQSFEKWW